MKTNDEISSTQQESLARTDQDALTAIGLESLPERHDNDQLEAIEYTLAEFHYRNGLRVVFSYDEISNDYGLLQEGRIGASTPLVHGEFDTLLEIYLSITPASLPIPEELLDEGAKRKDIEAQVKARSISPTCVVTRQLELPVTSPIAVAAGQTCLSFYYSWWDWHDAATPGMAPKTYYASSVVGEKVRYAQSYVFNCVPAGWGSWLWARHRIYYKGAGKYKKHFEGKVEPGFWQAKTKGSVKRWRKVIYDDGWNSSPSNSSLKYTREGRFKN